MLIIQPGQMEILGQQDARHFVNVLGEELRRRYPQDAARVCGTGTAGTDEFRDWVDKVVSAARQCGLSMRSSIRRFCEYSLIYSPWFPQHEYFRPVQEILQDASLPEDARMMRLDYAMIFVRGRAGVETALGVAHREPAQPDPAARVR